MATAELSGDGRIAIQTEYAEKELIRAVAGTRWDPQAKVWHAPLSWGTCLSLRGIFGQRLIVGPMLNGWAWEERTSRVDPGRALRDQLTLESVEGFLPPGVADQIRSWRGTLPHNLYPFQEVGIAFQYVAGQDLLGDEMGTGKTAQLILTLRLHREMGHTPFPACVITPNSVKLNWAREWKMWDPKVEPVVIVSGAAKKRKLFAEAEDLIAEGKDVAVIINIEAVRLHSRLAPYGSVKLSDKEKELKELNKIKFRSVGVDEAHRIKDPKAKQTRAIWAVGHGDEVVYRFAMSGTPIANHPGDLWPLMHFVAPADYPAKTAYTDRYCLQSWNPFGGLDIVGVRPDTKDEFYGVFDPRFRRMPKALVLDFLPPKTREIRHVEMSPKQKRAYREIDSQLVTRLDNGDIVLTTNNLTRNTRLLQFASAYAELNDAGEVRLSEPSPKVSALMEVLEESGDAAVVVAAESRQLIELAAARLEKHNIEHRLIVGGLTEAQRQQSVDDFQGGHARVLLMTLKAGGVGLTLTRANIIVFLQRSWSMIDNKQGEDRVHRIGSEIHDNVTVLDMVTMETIEEMQIPKLHAKFARMQEITRDIEVARASGDEAAVARLEQDMAAVVEVPLWPAAQEDAA